MKVLISGTSGFVGSNLIQFFNKRKLNDFINLNLRNPNWKSQIDEKTQAIIHLAGKAHDFKCVNNTNEYFEVNTNLTIELFDAFMSSNCSDFIFFSSVKAVTDKTNSLVNEEMIPNPQSVYGQSKLNAEQYLLSQMLPESKRLIIIRPSMIHGPGNKGNLNLLYKLVTNNLPWPLGAFENQRSFCSIDNVCFVINEILENKKIPSGIYNIADNQAISTNRLIELIAISQDKSAKIYTIPKKFIIAIAKFGDYLKLPLNSERLEKLTENFVVSNDKIVKAIGKPLPVNAEDGLMKTFNSFKIII